MKKKFKTFLEENKVVTLSVLFIILLLCYVAIPTLSELNNTNPMSSVAVWDGKVADSFSDGSGDINDPYIISNGNELAYLALQLETNNYDGKYFVLKNDIVLNDGIFSYTSDGGIKYTKDGDVNEIVAGTQNELVKTFKHLNNFKGTFSGNFHTIYGLYIDEDVDGQNGMFTNLEGNVNDLYIKNSLIYGGKIVGGVASKAINSSLSNVLYNGFVVSDEEVTNETISVELNDISDVTNFELMENLSITDFDYIPGIISSVTLSGLYQTDNSNPVLKINDVVIREGEFELKLNTNVLTSVSIIYQTEGEEEPKFSLTGLEYKINYNYGNASGIVSIVDNTSLKNIVNKAMVSASVYASGIVNTLVGEVTLENVYNVGSIKSDNISSGLISSINFNDEEVSVINCYNDGTLLADNSALIGNIEYNNGDINLVNLFNAQDSYMINLVESSDVNVSNSYILSSKELKNGEVNGEFFQTSLENLKSKSFIQEKLKYSEYDENSNDVYDVWVWMYDDDSLPILYIDDLNHSVASIHIEGNVWDKYNPDIQALKFSDKLIFSIEEVNVLNPINEIYYYISNDKKILSKKELDSIVDWNNYENIVEINEEGAYVVYAKIIDINNNLFYLNTDLLIYDLTGSEIAITSSYSDIVWKDFDTDLNNYYVNQNINVSIAAEDSLSGINKIYYYLSDTILLDTDLKKINEWNEYNSSIEIINSKTIVYVKVVDKFDYVTYANSDLIIMNGYNLESIFPGMRGSNNNDNLYITENSSVSLNFKYHDVFEYPSGSKHQLISNVLLPVNTKITLIDKYNDKVYVYVTDDGDYGYNDCIGDNCFAKYDFELFNEVGTKNKFSESSYSGEISEDFIVLVDFLKASIDKNIENISISLKLDNIDKNEIRNTLINSKKVFSVIVDNNEVSFELNSNFDDIIKYNENSQYIIDFSTEMNYMKFNGYDIFDTTFEDKNIGLSIKMVDEDGNSVDRQYLKNIVFKLGDRKYSPFKDGKVNINLEKGINDVSDNLIIQTYSDNYDLEPGNYKFIISLYVSYDGVYSEQYLSSIEIPIYVGENQYNIDNSFNVIMNKEDRIISKNQNEFNFEILVGNITENTDVRISLYKKDELSAFNQKYTIVDLGEYIIGNELDEISQNIYVLKDINSNNKLNINLNTSLLKKNGYMFVFELYEDNKLVNKINKKFIVK